MLTYLFHPLAKQRSPQNLNLYYPKWPWLINFLLRHVYVLAIFLPLRFPRASEIF